ncbi:ABC transporter substrate-binding protein [Neorhodopirellula pilleata]|uniref:ABC transporter substrate-binding protein n=1 Tax=Neorhodopirellula pilleata TaxID=2714738 RepID=UPI001E4D488D|nr:ABC transporter substrate-binding protein [Neorhodopirellula pilleata]
MNRRTWLAGASSLLAVAGCTHDPTETPSVDSKSASVVSGVPLRIVWVGSDSEVETMRRTWRSISEQPLDIRLAKPIDFSKAGSSDAGALFEQAGKADVVVYPLTMMAEMVHQERLMPLLSDRITADESDVFVTSGRRSMPAALKVATSFAGESRAVPLGGHLPALLIGETLASGEAAESVTTWADYYELAKRSDGKCAEPSAAGWAGATFLWRLASSLDTTWLFDRETLKPLIDQPDYVAVLEQMSQSVKLSSATDGRTPGQIYQGVAKGELVAGIGFPTNRSEGDETGTQLSFTALPSSRIGNEDEFSTLAATGDLGRLMMNPFMLVGSLASSCRQTAAADQFLDWLAGGEGSEPLYRNIDSIIDVQSTSGSGDSGAGNGYVKWLRSQLSNPNVVPPLQLIGASEYYMVLDEAVRECVHGPVSPQAACDKIAKAWSSLHQRFNLASQQRAWLRAQGIAS